MRLGYIVYESIRQSRVYKYTRVISGISGIIGTGDRIIIKDKTQKDFKILYYRCNHSVHVDTTGSIRTQGVKH